MTVLVAALWLIILAATDLSQANSYSYAPLMKDKLPNKVVSVSQWSWPRSEISGPLRDVTPATLQKFLSKGEWTLSDPTDKRLEATPRPVSETGLEGDPKFDAEILKWQEAQQALLKNYQLRKRRTGAMKARDGRHFRWILLGPALFRVEFGEGAMCFLELSPGNYVELPPESDEFEVTEGLQLERPTLARPDDQPKISPDFLPATGHHKLLEVDLVENFLKKW